MKKHFPLLPFVHLLIVLTIAGCTSSEKGPEAGSSEMNAVFKTTTVKMDRDAR
jgi:hypothetical protein